MIRRLTLATALLTLCFFAAPRPVLAFNFFGGANCSNGDNANSVVCKSQPKKDANGNLVNPLNNTLAAITNIIAFVAGAAAIIIIIISALRLITSGSDVSTGSRTDTDVENARRGIASALVGLVVIVLARTVILFVINKL